MKALKSTLVLILIIALFNCKSEKENSEIAINNDSITKEENVKVIPITHGTLVLETESEVIYIDPTGGAEAFKGQKNSTLVLITDIHGDHLRKSTLEALKLNDVTIIGPKAVTDKIPSTTSKTIVTINNGDSYNHNTINIEAIPMYNLREEALKYHSKGRGNGYVLTVNNERIYISGDTEDIPEMRNLENIDKAFICMNLPWTMTVKNAANAVLEFKPKSVYPYHYRGSESMNDVELFKKLVNEGNSAIEVLLLDWY
ncbi:MBL fold metallo-hydrolase [Winogradskyella sp. PG-2]|uniref:MBL fold metallo-hydrolase n=1 Tax=Winogradskyella sp. PG-2 TaxID=754409 RepID=UPI0004589496|nr:MBL fold metallo-hydrolase [Winogradskyella sp. PG-2]BAO77516.1 metal-dependent hydrolase [Winogradskyella sp. PG-2]